MEIKEEELERVVLDIKKGIESISDSAPQRVFLLSDDLGNLVDDGHVIDYLVRRLDEIFDFPILVREKRKYRGGEGDYSLDVDFFLRQYFPERFSQATS